VTYCKEKSAKLQIKTKTFNLSLCFVFFAKFGISLSTSFPFRSAQRHIEGTEVLAVNSPFNGDQAGEPGASVVLATNETVFFEAATDPLTHVASLIK